MAKVSTGILCSIDQNFTNTVHIVYRIFCCTTLVI